MSSLCCCRGFLALFGLRQFSMDVVAASKLERARAKQNSKTATSNDPSVVNTEPTLSDASLASSSRGETAKPKRRPGSRRSRGEPTRRKGSKKFARSFDDSDTDSSFDSAEENIRVMRKSIRRLHSFRGRDDLPSGGSGSIGSRSPLVRSPLSASSSGTGLRRSASREPTADAIEEDAINEDQYAASTEGRGEISPDPATGKREESATAFSFDQELPTAREGLGSRRLQRKAIRKVSPKGSPSLSARSVSRPSSLQWEVDDAGSVYRRPPSEYLDSDEDEMAMAREASIGDGRSSTFGSTDDMSLGGEVGLRGSEPISLCGTLDVAVQYSVAEKKLLCTIIEAHDLPSKARGGHSIVQVRAVLLPAKKKKYKTKVQHISSPRFAETFKLSRATPEELKGLALRLSMYGIGKLKDRLIGEAVIRFEELNLIRDPQLTIQLQLEPRADINRVDSEASLSIAESFSSSMMSLTHGGSPPEILLGLSYNAPTGRLCVEVIKGSHFRNLAMSKPPDTFVKLSLLNSACQEMSQSKTSVRRGQPNPVYKESFFFQVALFQLGEVTLMVSVYNKRTIKKKEMVGWVSMGRNSSSEPDEQHWHEMKEGKGQQVCRWHSLIDT